MNKVIILGALTRNPELKHTPKGVALAIFTVAHNDPYKENGERKERTTYIECMAIGRAAEVTTQYVTKGHRVLVEGKLVQDNWETKDGHKRVTHKIVVEKIDFIEKRTSKVPQQANTGIYYGSSEQKTPKIHIEDGDIPF